MIFDNSRTITRVVSTKKSRSRKKSQKGASIPLMTVKHSNHCLLRTEEQLVEALQSGSQQAFSDLVAQYQERVLNTALGFVPNLQDAEDIVQEVFIEVYRSIASFKGASRLSTWIYRITVSKSLEWLRHRKRKKRSAFFQSLIGLEDLEVGAVSDRFNHPGIQLEQRERATILFAAIDTLSENQRTAFTLSQVEGLSNKEVAAVMEQSVSAVESLLHRARKNLQKKLRHFYEQQKD